MNKNKKWTIQFPQNQNKEIIEPNGYLNQFNDSVNEKKEDINELKIKKSWEIANGPSKSILMTLFLFWISGNQIQIFPIIITIMNIYNPLITIFSLSQTFQDFEGISLKYQKSLFIFWNLIILSLSLIKCYYMGIFSNIIEMKPSSQEELIYKY